MKLPHHASHVEVLFSHMLNNMCVLYTQQQQMHSATAATKNPNIRAYEIILINNRKLGILALLSLLTYINAVTVKAHPLLR